MLCTLTGMAQWSIQNHLLKMERSILLVWDEQILEAGDQTSSKFNFGITKTKTERTDKMEKGHYSRGAAAMESRFDRQMTFMKPKAVFQRRIMTCCCNFVGITRV